MYCGFSGWRFARAKRSTKNAVLWRKRHKAVDPIMTLTKAHRFGIGAAFGASVAILILSIAELAGGRPFLWGAGLLLLAPSFRLLFRGK